jgi:hypothetical protein
MPSWWVRKEKFISFPGDLQENGPRSLAWQRELALERNGQYSRSRDAQGSCLDMGRLGGEKDVAHERKRETAELDACHESMNPSVLRSRFLIEVVTSMLCVLVGGASTECFVARM